MEDLLSDCVPTAFKLFTEQLTSGGTVSVGQAVNDSKLRYFLETARFDAYDVKSLMQWTVFGLPMYAIDTGISTTEELVRNNGRTLEEWPLEEELGAVKVTRSEAGTESLPAFVTPPVLNVLVENFNIAPISTPEEDLKAILG